MEKEIKLLERYIDDLLSHPDSAELALSGLGEDYLPLAEKLRMLGEWVRQADRYAGALAEGGVDNVPVPDSENIFAKNIRALERVMSRMTGQIENIVASDPAQREKTPRGADAHEAFDHMVQELQKRTSALENERNLFIQFTESASERIIVLDEENGRMLFANRVAREFFERTTSYIDDAGTINAKSGCTFQNPYSKWMHTVEHPAKNGEPAVEYYQVHSIYIIWENRGAIAHMFLNVTEIQAIQEQASKDSLTGAYSRSYGMKLLGQLTAEGKAFSLAFVDVDYLKYCNDAFGHHAGDLYLVQVVSLLQRAGKDAVICRTGGDEFMIICENMPKEQLKTTMEGLRALLCREPFDDAAGVRKSFSYGIAASDEAPGAGTQALLSAADERMYKNKLENKRANHLAIRDDRLC